MMDDFASVYTKDYTPKKGCRGPPHIEIPDYHNVISGPYTKYLEPATSTETTDNFEDPEEFRLKMYKKYPHLKNLASEIDYDIVTESYYHNYRTVTMEDYYDLEIERRDSAMRKAAREKVPRMDMEIQATTYNSTYRNPRIRARTIVEIPPSRGQPPVQNLRPNHKVREALRVTTGESEYEGLIGKLGAGILELRDRL